MDLDRVVGRWNRNDREEHPAFEALRDGANGIRSIPGFDPQRVQTRRVASFETDLGEGLLELELVQGADGNNAAQCRPQ